MSQKITQKLDRFFLAFLIINPFLDVLSGVYINVLETITGRSFDTLSTPLTPSLVIRMGVLVLFALSALISLDKKAVAAAIPVGAAWALSVAGEILFYYSFNLFSDVQYIARFAYNLAVILVYMAVFRRMGLPREELLNRMEDVMCFSLLLLSASIIVSYIFGVGYTTYADRYGYRGTRGFFYSGNDITAILMAGLPVVALAFAQLKEYTTGKYIRYSLSASMTAISLMLIGTKTAFIAVIAAAALMLGCAVWRWINKDPMAAVRLVVLAVISGLIFGLIALFSSEAIFTDIRESFTNPSETARNEDVATALFSGRLVKLRRALSAFREGGIYSLLFGIGRGTQSVIIEMDLFEVIIYYGLFGAVCMLWVYLRLGIGFAVNFFKNLSSLHTDMMPLGCLVSLGLCAGYLLIAGHVLFSVTSGFYFSFMLLYATALYADKPDKLKIF